MLCGLHLQHLEEALGMLRVLLKRLSISAVDPFTEWSGRGNGQYAHVVVVNPRRAL